jgi:putative transcriptional regulator
MTPENFKSMDALLANYSGGLLPVPAQVLVASHLEIKADNRQFVSGLERMAGESLETLEPCAIRDRDMRLNAVFEASEPMLAKSTEAGGSEFPRPLRDFMGFDVNEVPWQTKLPGFREFDVGEVDGCHVNLFWIRPGRAMPGRSHEGLELTLVLDGAFDDAVGHYGRGDISIADESVDHRPVASMERPCICMAVVDGDLRLTGSIGQRLSDLIGL